MKKTIAVVLFLASTAMARDTAENRKVCENLYVGDVVACVQECQGLYKEGTSMFNNCIKTCKIDYDQNFKQCLKEMP